MLRGNELAAKNPTPGGAQIAAAKRAAQRTPRMIPRSLAQDISPLARSIAELRRAEAIDSSERSCQGEVACNSTHMRNLEAVNGNTQMNSTAVPRSPAALNSAEATNSGKKLHHAVASHNSITARRAEIAALTFIANSILASPSSPIPEPTEPRQANQRRSMANLNEQKLAAMMREIRTAHVAIKVMLSKTAAQTRAEQRPEQNADRHVPTALPADSSTTSSEQEKEEDG